MTRRPPSVAVAAVVAVAGLLAVTGTAAAQTPPATPAGATVTIDLSKTGIKDRDVRWLLVKDRALVLGHITPYVAGEHVRIELIRDGQVVDQNDVKVEDNGDGTGKYQHRFPIHSIGSYTVRAVHEATDQQAEGHSHRQRFRAISAHVRDEESTRLLQIGLNRMAFVSPINGQLDDATRRAVLAYRKVNRYRRNTSPTSSVFKRIFHGDGGYQVRYTSHPDHAESDLSRQVLVLVKDGKPWQIYTVSSGKPSTPTVEGKFRFYRRQPGTNSHGMVWTTYFYGGYAVHGYASVPATYPASHGCIRVPIPDAYRIYKSVYLGEYIYVYSS